MKQNTLKHNTWNTFVFRAKHIALGSAVLIFGLGGAYAIVSEKQTTPISYPLVAPKSYGVTELILNKDHTGTATLYVDDLIFNVSFDFTTFKNSYGVLGSDSQAVEIDALTINQIKSKDGRVYKDFTDHDDHRNINTLITTYIEKNHLAEDV